MSKKLGIVLLLLTCVYFFAGGGCSSKKSKGPFAGMWSDSTGDFMLQFVSKSKGYSLEMSTVSLSANGDVLTVDGEDYTRVGTGTTYVGTWDDGYGAQLILKGNGTFEMIIVGYERYIGKYEVDIDRGVAIIASPFTCTYTDTVMTITDHYEEWDGSGWIPASFSFDMDYTLVGDTLTFDDGSGPMVLTKL